MLALSERLMSGIGEIIRQLGLKARVQGLGARFGILFGIDEEVTDYRQAAQRDRAMEQRFYAACLRHGVYVLGIHHGLSAAYTAADVEELLERLERALKEVATG
jgi:glutamate-1-semialdehyde 2,1-aminomutase